MEQGVSPKQGRGGAAKHRGLCHVSASARATHNAGPLQEDCRRDVNHNLPFSAVDWPELQEAFSIAFDLGHDRTTTALKVPGTRTFKERYILGPEGVVAKRVSQLLQLHARRSELGSSLAFDGVRMPDKTQVVTFAVKTGKVNSVVLVGRVGEFSQTSRFLADVCKAITQRRIDFSALNLGGGGLGHFTEDADVDDDDDDESDDAGTRDIFAKVRGGGVLMAADHVVFVGSDNASNATKRSGWTRWRRAGRRREAAQQRPPQPLRPVTSGATRRWPMTPTRARGRARVARRSSFRPAAGAARRRRSTISLTLTTRGRSRARVVEVYGGSKVVFQAGSDSG